jgi:hypothetical protein
VKRMLAVIAGASAPEPASPCLQYGVDVTCDDEARAFAVSWFNQVELVRRPHRTSASPRKPSLANYATPSKPMQQR